MKGRMRRMHVRFGDGGGDDRARTGRKDEEGLKRGHPKRLDKNHLFCRPTLITEMCR